MTPALLITFLFVSLVVGVLAAGIIIGGSISISNNITQRLRYIESKVYWIIALVVCVYFMSPPGIFRDCMVMSMTIAFYTLSRINYEDLESIDNRDI